MTPAAAAAPAGARSAILVGTAFAFVAAVGLARRIGPPLLSDADPAWAPARLLLALGLLAGSVAAGAAAAAVFLLWSRTRMAREPLEPLPFSRASLLALAAAALAVGVAMRGLWIEALPIPFLEDEVNLLAPALELSGTAADFSNAIRPIPYGRPDPHEMIGVAYLHLLRGSLAAFGTTIAGLRLPSLAGGCLSLVTAGLLGRALLPAGGGTLTVLALAGLRWHVILSLSGWHSVLLLPLLDVATLLLLLARRRGNLFAAAAGGAVMGIGAHLYLASWVSGAALAAYAAWPDASGTGGRRRLGRALLFGAGFLLSAAPIFLLREGRVSPYFGRSARHNVLREVEYRKSLLPILEASADALTAPWLLPDPEGRHDLDGASRLGLLALPVAFALARALRSPRQELSGLLLCHAGLAAAAAVAGGTAGHPNGFRFGYLTSITAVAAAAGTLALVGLAAAPSRRAAALTGVGLIAAAGLVGFRQALIEWPARRSTFDSFHGEDTLIGRAAARWEDYGRVAVDSGLGRSDLTIDTVRRYRLDPRAPAAPGAPLAGLAPRFFRVTRAVAAFDGERVVERVRDAWGREWAVVLARRS